MTQLRLKTILDQQLDISYPGYSFALYQANKKPLFLANGKLNYQDSQNQVNSDTIYDLASLTKVIATTTCILKLLEEGYFHLETPVYKLLPKFKHHNITIKQLLTHTSGLPADLKSYKQCQSKTEFIDFIYNIDLTYTPNEKVVYSDFGFILLGFIIETIKGSIPNYATEVLFHPLQMNNTTYHLTEAQKQHTAYSEVSETRGLIHGKVHDGKAFLLDGESGNAGLFSTAPDLLSFALMLLNDGTYHQQTILKPQTVQLLKQVYTTDLNENRTLGWVKKDCSFSQGDYTSNNILYHTGFAGTSVLIDFDYQTIIILLTNRVNPTRNNTNLFDIRNIIHNLAYLQ